MKNDNSTYTVTAPDLMLTENGMSVFISTTDHQREQDIIAIFEKYVYSSIIFNVQRSPTNENSVAWLWYVSQPCDVMIVDLDTASATDACAAMIRPRDDNHITIFLSEKNKKKDLVKLINATSSYPIMSNMDELEFYLKLELKLELDA